MKDILINILAFASLLSAILVITSKNPIISVIFLIFVFCCAALYLIFLGIKFIGISYIIIYIGAIAVIFLFIIMMLNIKLIDILESGSQYTKNIPLGIAIGSLFLYEIYSIIPFTFNNIPVLSYLLNLLTNLNLLLLNLNKNIENKVFTTYNPTIADTNFINFLQIQSVGHSLYTYEAILLIILSMILLLSMVAPIFLSRKPNII
jgi:NADH-ubiquinone oxidoreductase chain 6